MQKKLANIFVNSAGFLLLSLALAMFFSNWASAGFTLPPEPIFGISMRNLFWAAAGVTASVAIVCLFAQPRFVFLKMALVLWMAMVFVVCQIGFRWGGAHYTETYLYSLADTFGLSTGLTMTLLGALILFLLIGSSSLLVCLWIGDWKHARAGYLKMFCPGCGGHLEFLPQNLGQTIPCPHCQLSIILRKPDLLKMSCYFCKEHIEFPAHAIGTKMACPHCNNDITLKEPATP